MHSHTAAPLTRGEGPFRLLVTLFAALAFSSAATGHDFWIQPRSFRPQVGAAVPIEVMVGHGGSAEGRPRDPTRIAKFAALGPGSKTDVPGVDGNRPAGIIRPDLPGPTVVIYESTHSSSELPPAKFEAYLREVGLERIIELRAAQGATAATQREKYMRCAKSVLVATPSAATTSGTPASIVAVDQPLGMRLELVPKRIPTSPSDGALELTLLFEGKPIEGVLVVAKDPSSSDAVAQSRSSSEGVVSLKLPRSGVWLVTAVHMVPAAKELDAVWESMWASLTFEVDEAR